MHTGKLHFYFYRTKINVRACHHVYIYIFGFYPGVVLAKEKKLGKMFFFCLWFSYARANFISANTQTFIHVPTY